MNTVNSSSPDERLVLLDFIRGVAVLGILVMNIQSFTMPFARYANPLIGFNLEGVDYAVWWLSFVFFEQKFITLFSLLFGVGLSLFAQRLELAGVWQPHRHYKRMFWLFIIGLCHAYLIWYGDILTMYAIVGFVVYRLNDKSVVYLVGLALFCLFIPYCLFIVFEMSLEYIPAEEIEKWLLLGDAIEDSMTAEIAALNGSWFDIQQQRMTLAIELQLNVLFYYFRIIGLMLLGMAFYKMKVFQLKLAYGYYIVVFIFMVSFGGYLTLSALPQAEITSISQAGVMIYSEIARYWGSLLMALGYLSLLIVTGRYFHAKKWTIYLSQIGRMALTNYLLQSILCTFLVYGTGFALFGKLSPLQQICIVFVVWLILAVFSNFWLKRFLYGPAEWLWRSLTYGVKQPMAKRG